jgi:hypothetical protein
VNKYLNKTDFIVMGASLLSLIVFIVNTFLKSVIPLYFNGIVILGVFLYWSLKEDPAGILRKSLIIGSLGGMLYTLLDNIFVNQLVIIYLRTKDLEIYGTPISIILTWMYSISIGLYLYQRLRSYFNKFYIPSVLTGLSGSIFGILFDYLGNKALIWQWPWNINLMPSKPLFIGTAPIFFPVAIFCTFFLSPWMIGGQRVTTLRLGFSDNPVVGGIRFAVILASTMYIFFRIFGMVHN